jgi:hypothetical protein
LGLGLETLKAWPLAVLAFNRAYRLATDGLGTTSNATEQKQALDKMTRCNEMARQSKFGFSFAVATNIDKFVCIDPNIAKEKQLIEAREKAAIFVSNEEIEAMNKRLNSIIEKSPLFAVNHKYATEGPKVQPPQIRFTYDSYFITPEKCRIVLRHEAAIVNVNDPRPILIAACRKYHVVCMSLY